MKYERYHLHVTKIKEFYALDHLKARVDKFLESGVVYNITCPRCNACYVEPADIY